MHPDLLTILMVNLIPSVPGILVYILGIIFAITQRNKAPKAATIVVLSLVVLLLLSIVRPIVFAVLAQRESPQTVLSIFGLISTIVGVGAVAGLILAVFCDRGTPQGNLSPYAQHFGGTPPSPNPYAAPNPLPPR